MLICTCSIELIGGALDTTFLATVSICLALITGKLNLAVVDGSAPAHRPILRL